MIDSFIENINITTASFKITSSTCAMKNSVFKNIRGDLEAELLLVNLDSNLIIESLNFSDSSSSLLMSRNSVITINKLYADSINTDKSIIQISESEYAKIDDIEIVSVSVKSKQSIIAISDSMNVKISNLNSRNNDETVISLISSTIEGIDTLAVQN